MIAINEQIETAETMRTDSYTNIVNKYNTEQDNSTSYKFQRDGIIPDVELTSHYECNGLFAKIIDSPSEEAVKHGFDLGVKEQEVAEIIENTFDMLDWNEAAATAIKWSRLYGGAIIVMLIDDGGELTDPLNVKAIRKIDELRVYERSIVQPDYTAMLYGRPQYFQVSSIYGYFVVHESRCLVFKNGTLPEQTANMQYRFWGIPEYLRISRELRECSTSHGYGVRLLERSVQAIYKMDGLSELLETEEGEEMVLKRLRVIDRARGILNSIAISNGEEYDFKTITFSGVEKIIETTCNMLSAVTSIPQAILFGRSPAGMNATGKSDLENYYNLIERIQRIMLRGNVKTLTDIIIRAAIAQGEIKEKPSYKIGFKPLWSLSESEQADVEQKKAQTAYSKAQTAQIYVDMGSLDPSEVRAGLADNDTFDVEKTLDGLSDEELWEGYEEPSEESQENSQNPLTNSDEYDIMVCKDGDDDCRAADPAACPVHGNPSGGEKQPHAQALKNFEQAEISTDKKEYPFKDPNKARIYKSILGYELSDAPEVGEHIRSNVGYHPAKSKGSNQYGETFEVRIPVTGKNGNEGTIITGWMIDKGKDSPRLITHRPLTSKEGGGAQ